MYFTVNEDELTGRAKVVHLVATDFESERALTKICRILDSGKPGIVRFENEEEFVEIEVEEERGKKR